MKQAESQQENWTVDCSGTGKQLKQQWYWNRAVCLNLGHSMMTDSRDCLIVSERILAENFSRSNKWLLNNGDICLFCPECKCLAVEKKKRRRRRIPWWILQLKCFLALLIKRQGCRYACGWAKPLLRTPLISGTREEDVCMSEKLLWFSHKGARWTLQRPKWQLVFSPKSLLTWNIA